MPSQGIVRSSGPMVMVGLAAALVLVVSIAAAQSRRAGAGIEQAVFLPTMKVVSVGGKVVKLDTRTGALSIMRGSGGSSGSGDEWQLRVRAVKGSTSGMLDIQRVDGADASVFLVDVLGDRTWILKGRGVEQGEWVEMKTSP